MSVHLHYLMASDSTETVTKALDSQKNGLLSILKLDSNVRIPPLSRRCRLCLTRSSFFHVKQHPLE